MFLLKNKFFAHKLFLWILVFFVLACYLHYVQKYGLNLPLWDDYDTGLAFLLQWKAASGFHDKWQILLQQHNEHRLVLTKLLELSSYQIFGQINFKYLLWYGNIFLFLIVLFISFLIIPRLAENRQKLPMLLIIVSVLLAAVQSESQLWGMCGIEGFGQIFVSLLIIYLFLKYIEAPSRKSILFLMLLNFINLLIGGGFVALFIVLPVMAFIFKKRRFSCFLVIYFSFLSLIYFKIAPYNFSSYPTISIWAAIVFFFSFLGGGFRLLSKYIPFLVGVTFFITFLRYRKELQENRFIFCWVAFVIVTDLLLVKTRSHIPLEGLIGGSGASSRYATYSLITFIFLLEKLLLPRMTIKTLNWAAILSVFFFMFYLKWGGTYVRYHEAKQVVYYYDVPKGVVLYERAKNEGIYTSQRLDKIKGSVNNSLPR